MSWRVDITSALADFRAVAKRAGAPVAAHEFVVESLDAPHVPPKRLPPGQVAVYAFWGDGAWLKVGKAGPKTNARYTSQHYSPGSAPSTLARSLANCPRMRSVPGFDGQRPGAWLKAAVHRVNILLPQRCNGPLLALLEAYLHLRLKPRYEGRPNG